MAELERLTLAADGTVLRFGQFYGPGTAFAADGGIGGAIKAPEDADPDPARAGARRSRSSTSTTPPRRSSRRSQPTHAAIFNIVDDDPAPSTEWLPVLAAALGGAPPRRLPAWLARPVAGAYGVAFMTELRGADERQGEGRARLGTVDPLLAGGIRSRSEWAM